MAKEELFANPFLGALVRAYNAIPVHRDSLDRSALRAAAEVLRNGGVLLIFPGGRRDESGDVNDPKAGVGFIACMNNAPVVPAYITGSNRLARAFLRGGGVEVAFGQPIAAPETKSSDGYRALSQEIADEIGRLRQEVEGR
jgi:1-acyl-sn-glycerol-3-phosphate acyltransferase